jgi:hypothetical protein
MTPRIDRAREELRTAEQALGWNPPDWWLDGVLALAPRMEMTPATLTGSLAGWFKLGARLSRRAAMKERK